MEATGIYWEESAQFLALTGFTVSVVNPAQIKAYGASRLTRSKTDAVDARLIADFCAERQPLAWQARSEAEVVLRALVLHLDALQSMRTQENNRLDVSRDAVRQDIQQHIDWLDHAIKQLIKAIDEHISNIPISNKSGNYSTAFPASVNAPVRLFWLFLQIRALCQQPTSRRFCRTRPAPSRIRQ